MLFRFLPGQNAEQSETAIAAEGAQIPLFRRMVDFIYPPGCAICHQATLESHALCAQCWSRLTLIERPYCERLGTPFPAGHHGPLISPAAMAEPPVFERARSVCHYNDLARQLVTRLKYGDRPELARMMGRMMASSGAELLASCDLIVPVPLHRFRLWWRRYNQAAVLAGIVAAGSDRENELFLLNRIRHTRSQTRLSRNERQKNLQGAFGIASPWRGRIKGLRIVLIDDVLTSGATANAAARVLLRAGAAQVDILTFARVVKD